MANPVDLGRLKSQLLITGLQQSNNPLYQIIFQLITAFDKFQVFVIAGLSNILPGPPGPAGIDRQWSVLTNGDEASPELIFAGGDVIMVSIP
jgi:hypothetical protein